ncbi:MAG: hypothetical protein M3Y56_09610, partial [Armatimonadota bacterium]|nr:hypothetical protein [Armatimonadota bacterium]
MSEAEIVYIEFTGTPTERRLIRELRAHQEAARQLSNVISRQAAEPRQVQLERIGLVMEQLIP